MEENIDKEKSVENSKATIQQDAKGLWEKIKNFLYELLDFKHDTDQEATISAIKNDISIKGATAWILICSIFVASIGLNANSTAVVIGAMLISPLMGPILGVGLSIAINDVDTLRKSLINLATMIVLSLLTAFFFFFLFPLREETSELLGRVRPDIRDVLIAFFGGLALIIARTKKGTIASVIFGVAIATALMPPLCTAGYGLAIYLKGTSSGLRYFTGAMYLFTINTIFIALATFIVLKLLGFTMMRYVNSVKRKRIARIASIIAVLVMIPAVITFVEVYRESVTEMNYKDFLKKEIYSNNSLWLQRESIDLEAKKINLFFNGDIAESTETDLRNELKAYPNLQDFTLTINANKAKSIDKIMDAYDRAIADLDKKDSTIEALHKEINSLKEEINTLRQISEKETRLKNERATSFNMVFKDAKIKFNEIKEIGFADVLNSKDFIKVDTIPTAFVTWNESISEEELNQKEEELKNWLKEKMKLKKISMNRN